MLKTESALRSVELVGRNAEINQDSIESERAQHPEYSELVEVGQ